VPGTNREAASASTKRHASGVDPAQSGSTSEQEGLKMRRNALLWAAQVTLCALFVFAGTMKLVMPIEAMAGPVAFPGWFLRFIGVAELAGGLGLVLPGIFRIGRPLTALAAFGLVPIMVGATAVTIVGGMAAASALPAILGVLCATVARARYVPARSTVVRFRGRRAVSAA
jgi:hypothetical protein